MLTNNIFELLLTTLLALPNLWWISLVSVFLFSVANAFFATASILLASVCLCRLEALVTLAVGYCPSILPTHVSWPFCLS